MEKVINSRADEKLALLLCAWKIYKYCQTENVQVFILKVQLDTNDDILELLEN